VHALSIARPIVVEAGEIERFHPPLTCGRDHICARTAETWRTRCTAATMSLRLSRWSRRIDADQRPSSLHRLHRLRARESSLLPRPRRARSHCAPPVN
jgi:hypothetical protein